MTDHLYGWAITTINLPRHYTANHWSQKMKRFLSGDQVFQHWTQLCTISPHPCTHPVVLICYAPGGMLTKWLISLCCLQLATQRAPLPPSAACTLSKGPLKHTLNKLKIKVHLEGQLAQPHAFSVFTIVEAANQNVHALKKCRKTRADLKRVVPPPQSSSK